MRSSVALALVLVSSFAAAAPPDLVVVISIDQFRQEYVTRFEPWFSEGGFRKLMAEGAAYPEAWFPYGTTYTCVGHATIGTGRLPQDHGIIANEWFDDRAKKSVYCVDDERARPSEGNDGAYSPVLLEGDSLGDRLQERYPGSKVIGVGIKDRAAILMAGRKADAAYWFDEDLPGFVSSSYYRWNREVLAFNESVPRRIAARPVWEPSGLIPEADLARVTYDPEHLWKHKGEDTGEGSFPHVIADADDLLYTPFANDLVLDFARHVLDVEWMGREDGSPDILWVGLSAQDYLGHNYGPDSREVADAVVRLDRSLEAFFADLERRFGERVVVAVTADHGTQAIPEVTRDKGLHGGRISIATTSASKTIGGLPPLRRDLEMRIAKRLGVELRDGHPVSSRFLLSLEQPSYYLNWERIEALGLDPQTVANAVRDSLLEIDGVAGAWTAAELMRVGPPSTPLEQMARLSFRPDRAGDVLAYLKPGYMWSGKTTGSTHGQPVEPDQHVILMLAGPGVPKGRHTERAEIQQLARTLGHLLGIDAGTPGGPLLPGF